MAVTDVEKVLSVFAGISAGDSDLATRYIDHKRFCNTTRTRPKACTGLAHFVRQAARDQLQVTVVQALRLHRPVSRGERENCGALGLSRNAATPKSNGKTTTACCSSKRRGLLRVRWFEIPDACGCLDLNRVQPMLTRLEMYTNLRNHSAALAAAASSCVSARLRLSGHSQ